jgi:formate dehydrogenase iron-sulfur subunit
VSEDGYALMQSCRLLETNSTSILDESVRVAESALAGTLIEDFLADQGDLTAVERFARFHDHEHTPERGGRYSALLPSRPPGPGQQLAFEVDLDRCSGCKACVSACHSLNGLDEGEVWREVGLILGGPPGLPVIQHVTTACHHCVDPACLNACPVDAYEKDPITGIVKHLDDQCFGCQYCMLACPYDAPKFHPVKGIVRKCDMCSDRLNAGEAPACVQGCPTQAIRIRVVDLSEVEEIAAADRFLPTAPDPLHTLPTTRYLSRQPLPGEARPADHFRNAPEHAHAPLVVMLVLTQLSVGGFVVDGLLRLAGSSGGVDSLLRIGISLGFGFLGLAASVLHLGRPQYAFRALIGLRHSWLSREVAAFGLYGLLASVFVFMETAGSFWLHARPRVEITLDAIVVIVGGFGIFSSVMVYHVVNRPFWHASRSGTKFAATTLVLGLATAILASAWLGTSADRRIVLALIACASAKLLIDASIFLHRRDPRLSLLRRTAELLQGSLARPTMARVALGVVGGLILPLVLAVAESASSRTVCAGIATASFLTLLGGELLERVLFFTAVVRPKMPGGMMP